jgi:two-component system sensor histidine kinase QseC
MTRLRLLQGRLRSLQGRLVALVVGLVALVWLASAAFVVADARHELAELLDAHLAQAAALLVAQNLRELGDDEDKVVDAPLLHRYAPRAVFQVWHEGRLALRSANAPTVRLVAPGAIGPDGFATVQRADGAWRVFATRGAERDVQVFVGEQVGARDAILRAVLRGMLLPLLLALPVLALAGFWAVRRGLLPLRRLGDALAARRPEALEPIALPDAPAEMQPMLAALNGLFGRIGALLDGERRFTADAAHELRTPIAAIRAQAQVALGAADDAARRHALASTIAGCDRAARLIEQLLTLARLEAGGAGAAASVDLAALARRVVGELAPQAVAAGGTLALDAPPSLRVPGHDGLLGVLLRNLVDNALRYGPAGGEVLVTLAGAGATATLQVDDAGPGLADGDLARLGERFFRAADAAASGSGLGWSIVRRVAALHGATVDAACSPTLGGLRVTVRLPAAGLGGSAEVSAETARAA